MEENPSPPPITTFFVVAVPSVAMTTSCSAYGERGLATRDGRDSQVVLSREIETIEEEKDEYSSCCCLHDTGHSYEKSIAF